MKKIVADSSVAIKWFVPQPHSLESRQILDAYKIGELIILAPDLIYPEVGNIMWKLHRFQGLSQVDAEAIIKVFKSLKIMTICSSSLITCAYDLAVRYQRTVYDSLYVALSVQEQCQFVTADEKLVNSISGSFPNVVAIKNWS